MRARSAVLLAVLALGSSACATGLLGPGAARPHAVRLFSFERQPRLSYARLRLGAMEGWFLVDTGASRHVVSAAFYGQAFPERPLGEATTAALSWSGAPQPMSEARALPVVWPDGRTESIDFVVGDFLPPEAQSGMVGVISPQRLADRVELDFPAGELRWPAGAPAGARYSEVEGTLVVCGGGNAVYGWATAINGVAMWGLLDTGAVLTGLSLRHPLAQRLLPSGGGAPVAMGDASRTPVLSVRAPAWGEFGGRQWRGHIVLMQMDRSPCDFPAVIGMDVLSRCRITLEGSLATARCG